MSMNLKSPIKLYTGTIKKFLFILPIIFILVFSLSCNSGNIDSFRIYLTDSGETVLTGDQIQSYNSTNGAFELNQDGIKKWNSYLTSQTVPKLESSLFSREFVLEIDGREICRGEFWSGASSASYSGIVILDALFTLDTSNNLIWIKTDYPSVNTPLDPSVNSEIVKYFRKHN